MMRTMIRRSLPAALLTGLAVGTGAQTAQETLRPVPIPVDAPAQHWHYDYVTGTLTRLGSADDQNLGVQAASVTTYDNTCTSGFLGDRFSPDEWFDWA